MPAKLCIIQLCKVALCLAFSTFARPWQKPPHIPIKVLYEQSQLQLAQLRHELDQLKKMIFGARQERFVPDQPADAAQLSMGLSAEPVAAPSLIKTQKIEYKRLVSVPIPPTTTHQGRMKLPDHLERKEILAAGTIPVV